MPPPETPRQSQTNLGQSLVGPLLLSPGSWCTQGFLCGLQESIFPVLCKFWGAVWWGKWQPPSRELMPYPALHPETWPCGRPLLTRTAAGDSQTLKGRSGSVSVGSPGVHKVLSEPSERLWWIWGLILNAISSPYHLTGASPLSLDVGYLFLVGSNILLCMVFSSEL